MCGIAGFWNSEGQARPDDPRLPEMIQMLRQRGRTGCLFRATRSRFWPCASQHHRSRRRQQPIHNEDRSVWVTFNGDLQYIELRAELEAEGHRFCTRTEPRSWCTGTKSGAWTSSSPQCRSLCDWTSATPVSCSSAIDWNSDAFYAIATSASYSSRYEGAAAGIGAPER